MHPNHLVKRGSLNWVEARLAPQLRQYFPSVIESTSEGGYVYHVVPFEGQLRSGQDVDAVSRQLADIINAYSSEGWQFDSVSSVHIRVQPGCLAALFGAGVSYITYDQVIFRKEG